MSIVADCPPGMTSNPENFCYDCPAGTSGPLCEVFLFFFILLFFFQKTTKQNKKKLSLFPWKVNFVLSSLIFLPFPLPFFLFSRAPRVTFVLTQEWHFQRSFVQVGMANSKNIKKYKKIKNAFYLLPHLVFL